MKLIGKFELQDPFGNKKTLSISTDRENGHVSYRLVNNHTSFAISNMQCGWRGPKLPDNTYEYPTNTNLMSAVKEAINGGVYSIIEEKLFVK
jgi:hypothetical protein